MGFFQFYKAFIPELSEKLRLFYKLLMKEAKCKSYKTSCNKNLDEKKDVQ